MKLGTELARLTAGIDPNDDVTDRPLPQTIDLGRVREPRDIREREGNAEGLADHCGQSLMMTGSFAQPQWK